MAVSLYEKIDVRLNVDVSVFTGMEIYIYPYKNPSIVICNTCTTRRRYHLQRFLGRHWSRQWLGVIRQQATSWARDDPCCCFVASLGRIGLIPSTWFGICMNIWNHRYKPVSYLHTNTHIHIRTEIVSNIIWNTGRSITLWGKAKWVQTQMIVHRHAYTHIYIHMHTYMHIHTYK